VRGVVARYVHLPEKDVYEVLVAEAEGWEMRLRELEDEQNETEQNLLPGGVPSAH
jgi:hypothetical protein